MKLFFSHIRFSLALLGLSLSVCFVLFQSPTSFAFSEERFGGNRTSKKSERPAVDKDYIENVKKDWKFLYEKDHVYVFKKELKDSPITAFRGVAILPVPMDVLFHIVRDTEKSQDWTPNLAYKKLVRNTSLVEGVTYNMNTLPSPATDRETLLLSKLSYDSKRKMFVVETKSVELPDYPEKKEYVRGVVYESSFLFRPVEGGTLVDLDAHIDPKGTLPAWLINFIQVEWSYKFLMNLEKFAKKGGFKPEIPFSQMMKAYQNKENIDEVFEQFNPRPKAIPAEITEIKPAAALKASNESRMKKKRTHIK